MSLNRTSSRRYSPDNSEIGLFPVPRHPLWIDAILHPSVYTSFHSVRGRVPRPIRIDDHLTEGDVVSPRAAETRVREKTSIPQHPINPRDAVIATPFSDGILPPKGSIVSRMVWQREAAGGRRRWC